MRSAFHRSSMLGVLLTIKLAQPLQAYGPLGHEIVGGIADKRLANTAAGRKVKAFLDGIPSLSERRLSLM